MHLHRFTDPTAFYEEAEPYLLKHEAENNLTLGICASLISSPRQYSESPYLTYLKDARDIVATVVRTPPHNVVFSHVEEPDAVAVSASDLHGVYPTLRGVLGPREVSREFSLQWSELSGQQFRPGRAQRIHQLQRVITVSGVPGEFRRATASDRDLLVSWLTAFNQETGDATGNFEHAADAYLTTVNAGFYLWQDGVPVSMAGYGGPTPNGIRISAVYTPPEVRRRGYASALVAGLSQLLLERGRTFCFLFTDLANPTANKIYHAIGYEPVCDVDEYLFSDSASD